MSGLMNSYFYGKAGQGDYTVEQMPANRKELFFTTLKVRFSSMIGLNLLHVLWFIPVAIWLYIAMQTATMYLDDETVAKLGNEPLAVAYTEYDACRTQYNSITGADKTLDLLAYDLEFVQNQIAQLESGKEVMVEEAAVVEGGESTVRPATMEELKSKEAQIIADIAIAKEAKANGEDEAFMEALRNTYNEKYNLFVAYRRQALNGNLLMSLLIMIPLLGILGIGHTGQAYVLRNWARDEHSFMIEDYKASIKNNWKQGLIVGLLNGFSFFITFIAYTTYGSMAESSWFFTIPQMLMIVMLILWWMMNEIIFFMMVTYEMKVTTLIRNSLLMVIARLPKAFILLLGMVIVPAAILLFVPYVAVSILVLIVIYGLFGFSFCGFLKASFANSCFDKYLNPRIAGAKVNQGLRQEEPDDEDEVPAEVEQKEERFWEHKTK